MAAGDGRDRIGGVAISGEASAPEAPDDARDPGAAASRSSYREVFASGEFRGLWLAQMLSVLGDQLARVALTLLVYEQTRSPLLAAVTFAASVLPTFIGGIFLSGLADRLPRREVMIACDLVRAAMVVAMAAPGAPIGLLIALLFLVTMISAPFTSARAALYADILEGDRYVLATAVTYTTLQVAQVLGFALGGAAVGLFGVRPSLLADAATFLASALLTRVLVRKRPAAQVSGGGRQTGMVSLAGVAGGVRMVFANPGMRVPMLYGWLAAFLDVHEGVAAPLAADLGGGATATGLILAAGAFGVSVGAVGFSRLVGPRQRLRWMGSLAVASCAVLVPFAARPSLPWALGILTASGILSCFQVAANAAFVSAAPVQHRSQVFGVAQAGMSLGQGVAMMLAGAAAEWYAPSVVIAASGALGALAALLIAAGNARTRGRLRMIR